MKISPIVRIMRTEDCAFTLPIPEYHSLSQKQDHKPLAANTTCFIVRLRSLISYLTTKSIIQRRITLSKNKQVTDMPPVNMLYAAIDRHDCTTAYVREFLKKIDMKAGDLPAEVESQNIRFSDGRCLLWYDGPVISTVRADGLEGLLMQVLEEETRTYYILVVPTPKVMSALRSDQICLRTAYLNEQSMLYLTDDCVEGEGRVLSGPVHEYLLPEEGFFMSEFYENPYEMED